MAVHNKAGAARIHNLTLALGFLGQPNVHPSGRPFRTLHFAFPLGSGFGLLGLLLVESNAKSFQRKYEVHPA